MTAAADIQVGQTITAGWLPCGDPAKVIFVYPYKTYPYGFETGRSEPWVFVVYQCPDGEVAGFGYLPRRDIPTV